MMSSEKQEALAYTQSEVREILSVADRYVSVYAQCERLCVQLREETYHQSLLAPTPVPSLEVSELRAYCNQLQHYGEFFSERHQKLELLVRELENLTCTAQASSAR